MFEKRYLMYAVVDKCGGVEMFTLAFKRAESIRLFREVCPIAWIHSKAFGHKCMKLDVSIKPFYNNETKE